MDRHGGPGATFTSRLLCDDTAVALVQDDKKVLSSRRFADRETQRRLGGISPREAALQHKEHLPRLLGECLQESGLSVSDVDAIAVTTKPGLVIALKEGIRKGESTSGSPGECLDKIARELRISEMKEFLDVHPGAAVEQLASRSSPNGHLRYSVIGPHTSGADMNFSQLKSSYLNLARKHSTEEGFSIEDFCASVQLGRCASISRNTGVRICSRSLSYRYLFSGIGTVKTEKEAWNNDSPWGFAVEDL
ncbi:peptidase, M22 family [Ancylostoma ceylanicum]|uniref:Peptidase, M22 family n=1 Tax=Ancylostoma ceylanicum TaxID=53326 RepID=A0A0D6LFM0_9BILA|nr:peptidase, M22 family [Ancylostoma ceylanicum]